MASEPPTLHAVVDMGSNGIRFSITNTSILQLPTLYHARSGISLYDAQFSSSNDTRQPIPDKIIQDVLTRLVHFQSVCEDFDVPSENVHVLATEATRTAPNSEAFRAQIRERTGWEVKLLKKEEEGRIGAMGVVASCGRLVGGLVMDLGGGSTQITWIMADGRDGGFRTSPRGSLSFPYGAAALKNKLEQIGENEKARMELRGEMVRNFQHAYRDLEVPEELLQMAKERGGLDLYLCGGGFRGWGYLLMEQAPVNPFPIPIINGFRVRKEAFHNTASVLRTMGADTKIFGVSKRRASQVPAVAFLVNVLVDALPGIQNIQFCQGGVREGFLFDRLPAEIRAEDPLLSATRPYATPSADAFQRLLSSALPSTPPSEELMQVPPSCSPHLLSAVANLLFFHVTIPKESRCAAALHSTTTGLLASTNNQTHTDRALLALILCERWDGELAPTDQSLYARLSQCVSAREFWWCRYLGRVAALIGDVYPAGKVSGNETRWRIQLDSQWDVLTKEKKGERQTVLRLRVRWNGDVMRDSSYSLNEHTGRIEKVGKRKNWVDGNGVKVRVESQSLP